MSARRYNNGKIRIELIPPEFETELARVFTIGAEKYTLKDEEGNIIDDGADNWRKGLSWRQVLGSIYRHLNKFERGEDFDYDYPTELLEKYGPSYHLANAAWGISILMNYYKTHPELDDRLHDYLKPKRIALDVDGVLCNFSKGFIDLALSRGCELPPNIEHIQPHWNFPYSIQYLWQEVKQNKEFWLNLEPLAQNKTLTFEPYMYISSRGIPVEWTQEWLEKNGYPAEKVVHTFGSSKVGQLRENNIDIMVDDAWENFIDCTKAGIFTYLMDASYNQKYKVGFRRIKSLKEIE